MEKSGRRSSNEKRKESGWRPLKKRNINGNYGLRFKCRCRNTNIKKMFGPKAKYLLIFTVKNHKTFSKQISRRHV